MKRLLYILYYLKQLDKEKFNKFLRYTAEKTGRSKLSIWKSVLTESVKYNISLLEYFNFRFYEISDAEKQTYAGTGYMYEYQLQMNPAASRNVLEDKLTFLKDYGRFVQHGFASLTNLEKDASAAEKLLANKSGKIVLKDSKGQCGIGIVVKQTRGLTPALLVESLKETHNDFAEEFVTQHSDLMRLSPSGLNTIRIITQLDKNKVVNILGCRLRITINSSVDNLAAGNIAAPIDEVTGVVAGPGVYSDITKGEEYVHPVTGVPVVGFQVPYWNETITMIKNAALVNTNNRSIGWDVAITQNGPELIEGNHDWCKLLWQLPVKKGLKPMLEAYL